MNFGRTKAARPAVSKTVKRSIRPKGPVRKAVKEAPTKKNGQKSGLRTIDHCAKAGQTAAFGRHIDPIEAARRGRPKTDARLARNHKQKLEQMLAREKNDLEAVQKNIAAIESMISVCEDYISDENLELQQRRRTRKRKQK